jgi:hypothetical protein
MVLKRKATEEAESAQDRVKGIGIAGAVVNGLEAGKETIGIVVENGTTNIQGNVLVVATASIGTEIERKVVAADITRIATGIVIVRGSEKGRGWKPIAAVSGRESVNRTGRQSTDRLGTKAWNSAF